MFDGEDALVGVAVEGELRLLLLLRGDSEDHVVTLEGGAVGRDGTQEVVALLEGMGGDRGMGVKSDNNYGMVSSLNG